MCIRDRLNHMCSKWIFSIWTADISTILTQLRKNFLETCYSNFNWNVLLSEVSAIWTCHFTQTDAMYRNLYSLRLLDWQIPRWIPCIPNNTYGMIKIIFYWTAIGAGQFYSHSSARVTTSCEWNIHKRGNSNIQSIS